MTDPRDNLTPEQAALIEGQLRKIHPKKPTPATTDNERTKKWLEKKGVVPCVDKRPPLVY